MPTCIYSKAKFDFADGEHILQNFLGARWVSNQIVCNEVQKQFGETIDCDLEKALRPFRNLLGSKGGRGGDGPPIKNLKSKDGRIYHLLPGGKPILAKPYLSIKQKREKHFLVEVELASKKQVDWLLSDIKKQIPEIDSNNLSQLRERILNTPSKQVYLTAPLVNKAVLGGEAYFKALLKASFNLLGVMSSEIALSPCFDSVREYIAHGKGDFKQFIRWSNIENRIAIEQLSNFDHFIGIYSNGNNVDGVFQVFGSIYHMFRLTNHYSGEVFCYSYAVNPLRNTEPSERRNMKFDVSKMPKFDEGTPLPDESVWPVYREMIKTFFINHSHYARELELERIIRETFEKYKEETDFVTPEMIGEISVKVAKFAMRYVPRVQDLIGD